MTGETVVRRAIGELVESAERLRALADLLDGFGATPFDAEPAELRRTALGIRALAEQTIALGAAGIALSERLSTIASVREGET